ncbi:MAG: hypothetical protein QJR09_05205 [Micrococcus sp.]|nr:hypothetical protein [Micrococcus sp.]
MATVSKYEPTQVQEPGRAAARTIVADVIGAGLVLVVILPEILRIFEDELGGALPEGIRLWLGGAVVFTAGLAGAVTRIMAIPRVNRWLAHFGLAAGAPPAPRDSPGMTGE